MNNLIVGADVCKDRIVCCLLTTKPTDPQEYYLTANFQEFPITSKGLNDILSLNPSAIVLEPTGVNYSKFWVVKLAENGVNVYLVDHKKLSHYRTNLDLPTKDDQADSLALACYYFDYKDTPRRFVRIRDGHTNELRDRSLRLQHLSRVQSPLVNRLKQDLQWAFPEKAKATLNSPLFFKWLSGRAKSIKYDRLLKDTCGLGINDDVRWQAAMLCDCLEREKQVELDMIRLLNHDNYRPYRKVLSSYGIGLRAQALIISQIFPLSNFLDENLNPITVMSIGKISKKRTMKHLSLRRFQKTIGVVPNKDKSGDSEKKANGGGSDLCRSALWLWCFTRVESSKGRLRSPLGDRLNELWLKCRSDKDKIKLARGKFVGNATKMIFYDLVNEIKNH
jgi:hypothetical protein